MASVGRGLRAAVVRLVTTLLVFRVAERVSVTVESPAVVETRFDDQRMYTWPCLCSCRLVVSPMASNSSQWLTVASLVMSNLTQVLPHNGSTPVVFVLGQFAPTRKVFLVMFATNGYILSVLACLTQSTKEFPPVMRAGVAVTVIGQPSHSVTVRPFRIAPLMTTQTVAV